MRFWNTISKIFASIAFLIIGRCLSVGTDVAPPTQILNAEECFIPDLSEAFYQEVGLGIEEKECKEENYGDLTLTQYRYVNFESDAWVGISISVREYSDEATAASFFQDYLRGDCFWSKRNKERDWHHIGGTDFRLYYEVVFKEEGESESIWRLIDGDTLFTIKATGFDFRENDYWTLYREQLISKWELRSREFKKQKIEQITSGNPDKPGS